MFGLSQILLESRGYALIFAHVKVGISDFRVRVRVRYSSAVMMQWRKCVEIIATFLPRKDAPLLFHLISPP